MTSPARVLVVDDSARLRTSLRRALTLQGFDVETATDGDGAIAAVAANPPHVIVLDRLLPGCDGIEVCSRLRRAGDNPPVLMLTVCDTVAARVEGLDAGADDYLVKPFALRELVARLHALLRRSAGAAGSGGVLAFADLTVDTASRDIRRAGRVIELTPTEFELLVHLLLNPLRVLAREEILQSVWGYPSDSASNTLDVYVGYLRRKLEAAGEVRIIHTVRGIGYALREP
jgi:two-component system response regulator MprA